MQIMPIRFSLPDKWSHLLSNLPVENLETALREKLKNEPQTLVGLFLDLVQAKAPAFQPALAAHLVQDISALARLGKLSRHSLASVSAALQYNPARLVPLFPADLAVTFKPPTQSEQVLLVSRLVLMATSEYFEKFLGPCFKESTSDTLKLEQIASHLSFEEFAMLYPSLRSGDPRILKDCNEQDLWSFAKQFHLWNMPDWQKEIEKFIIEKTKTPLQALESLSGCDLYNMIALKVHCLKIIGLNQLHFKVRNGSVGATILNVTEENMSLLEELSDDITRISMNDKVLIKPPMVELMHALPKLESLHLIVSEEGISSTARKILGSIPNISCLKLQYGNPELLSRPENTGKSSPSGHVESGSEEASMPYLQRLDLQGCPKALKRVALSTLKFLPNVIDIRLLGLTWVDDKFIEHLALLAPQLILLDLGHCKITDSSLYSIAKKMLQLEMLDVKGSMVTGAGLSKIMLECKRLSDLNISSCHHIAPGFLVANSAHLGRIKTLKMQHCPQFSSDDFDALITHGVALELLNVSHCKGFTQKHLERAVLPRLQVLSIDGSLLDTILDTESPEKIDPTTIFDKKRLPKLEKISIQGRMLPSTSEVLNRFGFAHPDISIEWFKE